MTSPLDRTFAAVLFDLDGTLISSLAAVERSWAQLFEEYAIPPERFFVPHGIPARDLLESFMDDRSPEDRAAAFDRIVEIEVADTAGVDVLPGAMAALEALAPSRRCAIVTSGTRDLAHSRLVATGLPVPAVVITADDVTHGKPHPEPYVAGAAALGVDVTDCLVVEDARSGIASGRAAGASILALATNVPAEELDGDLVVPDLSHVRFEPTPDGVRLLRRRGR